MSEFNKYAAYSQAVELEIKSEQDDKHIMDIINSFRENQTVESAKSFLKEKMNIINPIENLALTKNASITVKEKPDRYVVKFCINEDKYIFSYKNDKKGV